MADNNRSRLLLLKHLQKFTDDEHFASVADITEMLEKMVLKATGTPFEMM